MNIREKTIKTFRATIPLFTISMLSVGLFGCGSDDKEETGVGYIQLYNASKNSPAIYLTVDKETDDEYQATTHSGVIYGKTGGQFDYLEDSYDIDFAWRDEDDITDLESLYQTTLDVSSDTLSFLVISENIEQPNFLDFSFPIISEESDETDELTNIRILNLYSSTNNVDFYISESDETFNEATLLNQYSYEQMSDNLKLEQDSYTVYLTFSGETEVLYRSSELALTSTSQSVLVIRENQGVGSSPFTIDKVSNTIQEYPDLDAESQFRIYNGIATHELLEQYQGDVDFYLDGFDETAEFSAVSNGNFSDSLILERGDYGLTLTVADSDELIIENHLLTLDSNSDKSVFFYLLEENVDEDGDGDVDENDDGIVDEVEVTANSLVVENSRTAGIYSHNINVINLIDDFNNLRVYFVLSDETTETASAALTVPYIDPTNIPLRNNTYQIYMIGKDDSSELILGQLDLTLDESSRDMFLILEENEDAVSGYQLKLVNQQAE